MGFIEAWSLFPVTSLDLMLVPRFKRRFCTHDELRASFKLGLCFLTLVPRFKLRFCTHDELRASFKLGLCLEQPDVERIIRGDLAELLQGRVA